METFYWYDLGDAYTLAETKKIPLAHVGEAIQGRRATTRLWGGISPVGMIEGATGRGDGLYPKLRFPDGTWTRLDLTIHMAVEDGIPDVIDQLVVDSLRIWPNQSPRELAHTAKLGQGAVLGALGRLQRGAVATTTNSLWRIAA